MPLTEKGMDWANEQLASGELNVEGMTPEERNELQTRIMEIMRYGGETVGPGTEAGNRLASKFQLLGFMNPKGKGAAFGDFYQKMDVLQKGLKEGELYDPVSGRYGDEYRSAMEWDVNRQKEIEQARAADMMANAMQTQGASMARQVAAGGPTVSPLVLQAQQNQLAQQLAAQRAAGGGGALAARNAMMAGLGAGGQMATQGIGQMVGEQAQNWGGAQQAVGGTRQANLASAGLMTAQERANDAYRNARAMGAMGYLGMGEDQKQANQQALLKLLGASTGQEQQAKGPSTWQQTVAGLTNMGSSMLAAGAQYNPGGGGGGGTEYKKMESPAVQNYMMGQ